MCDLKKTLDAGGNAVLECPSGSGKTVSLLSLIVAYQLHFPEHRKLIYCSRTMSEIEKALAELKNLMAYREKELGFREEFRGLGLTSRKNLCLHPVVKREKKGNVVDARCRSLTAGFVKEKKLKGEDVELCIYHEVMPWNNVLITEFGAFGTAQFDSAWCVYIGWNDEIRRGE
jgi:DNA excision repair protein ERCC-2